LAFGAGEVLMLIAYIHLLPRGAVDRNELLDLLRAATVAGGTAVIFWVLPPIAPRQELPAFGAVFMVLALASGLILRTDLEKIVYLVQGKLERL
jgi:hypothetical protein